MEDFITRHEHEEYVKRIEQEHKGMNARIKDLETEVKEIADLTISINKLALSVDSMAREQKKQREQLESLKARDGERWRTVTTYIITAVIGILIGFVFKQIGF